MVRRLYRSRSQRLLGGVCGGLAEYLNTDPTVIRLLWVLFSFMGAGFIVYLVAWVLVPEEA